MSIYNRLRELSGNDIEFFNLKGKSFVGKITHVYNSSECDAVLLVNNIVFKFKCVLNGLDIIDKDFGKITVVNKTMDIGLLGVETDDEINLLENNNNKLLNIKCGSFIQSGKLDVTLYEIDNVNLSINQILIDELSN